MKTANALSEFKKLIENRGNTLEEITVEKAIELMVLFYKESEATDIIPATEGDMLLFQWGIYDWGQGEYFEYNITRQLFPKPRFEDDTRIMQLSLTLKFIVNDQLKSCQSGNKWYKRNEDSNSFQGFISSNGASIMLKGIKPSKVILNYGDAE